MKIANICYLKVYEILSVYSYLISVKDLKFNPKYFYYIDSKISGTDKYLVLFKMSSQYSFVLLYTYKFIAITFTEICVVLLYKTTISLAI